MEQKENLHKILKVLITGSPEEYKEAKKEIERLYWSNDADKFRGNAIVAFEYIDKFEEIKNPKNKVAFLSGLSLFFLVLSDDYFERLKDFTLEVIQNPDGHVREAIRKTSDWLFISLSSRMNPFIHPHGRPLTTKQKEEQRVARRQFGQYLEEVEKLMDKYRLKENEKVKYVDEMKPSVEKSLQMLWGRLSDLLKHACESSPKILRKRKEIERKLSNLLTKYKVKSSVRQIKEVVFEENNYEDLHEIIKLFKSVKSISELNYILSTLNDVWNYFPHKSLGGLSPYEKRLEYLN